MFGIPLYLQSPDLWLVDRSTGSKNNVPTQQLSANFFITNFRCITPKLEPI